MAKARDFDASPEGKAVLHALIDHELEAQRHVEEVLDGLGATKAKLKKLTRRLYNARCDGSMTKRQARAAWRDGFLLLALLEYASDVSALMGVVDSSLETQYEAIKRFARTGKSLTTLSPIRNIDIKTRATEKAAAKLAEGEAAIHLRRATPLKGPGSGRLPDMDKLIDKTPEQLEATLRRFDLQPNIRAITVQADKVYDKRLGELLEAKGTPDAETWKILEAETQRAVTTVLRQQTKAAMRDYRALRVAGVAENYIWIAIGDGSCPSCENRHGERYTWAQWEDKGLPGSAVLVCKSDCRCSLVPDLIDGGEVSPEGENRIKEYDDEGNEIK